MGRTWALWDVPLSFIDRHHAREAVMRWLRSRQLWWAGGALALGTALMVGCGQRASEPVAPRTAIPSGGSHLATPGSVSSSSDCAPALPLDPLAFTHSTRIDNRFFPLVPGTQFVLEGQAERGGAILPHQVVLTVTDMVKTVDGVNTVVLWDRDFSDGELVEAELAFHAQDNAGNVWNLGEYPEEYEDGEFTGAPNTWISGANGLGGIIVEGNPRLSDKFLQGVADDIAFLDCAKILKLDESTCVPTGCYSGVLVVAERSPLEPGSGTQLKYYAPGVGNVRIAAIGDKEDETLVLISVNHLNTPQMKAAHKAVVELEKRAYQVSQAYASTSPAH